MNIEDFQEYCLSLPATWADMPFDDVTLVMKVGKKMFAVTGLNREGFKVNLKCDPEYAIELREKYPEIEPGWHSNKKHWNTVDFEGSLSPKMLQELVKHSYDMVVKKMTKKEREALFND